MSNSRTSSKDGKTTTPIGDRLVGQAGVEKRISNGDESDLDFPVTNSMLEKYREECSDELVVRVWGKLKTLDYLGQKLRAAQASLEPEQRPFPGLLEAIRTAAKVSVEEIASVLKATPKDILNIEAGRTDPLSLSPEVIERIMELFSLPLPKVADGLQCYLATKHMRTRLSQPSTRSVGGKVNMAEYERVMSDVAAAIVGQEGGAAAVEVPKGLFEGIEAVLRRRGRGDLL